MIGSSACVDKFAQCFSCSVRSDADKALSSGGGGVLCAGMLPGSLIVSIDGELCLQLECSIIFA